MTNNPGAFDNARPAGRRPWVQIARESAERAGLPLHAINRRRGSAGGKAKAAKLLAQREDKE